MPLWRVDPERWTAERIDREQTDADSPVTVPSVYGAFATWYGGRVVRLEHHFQRLADSARRVGIAPPDAIQLRRTIARLLEESGYPEARVRVTLTGGSGGHGGAGAPSITVQMSAYGGPPLELQKRGVACGVLRGVSRETPEAKQTSWLSERARLIRASGRDYYEWLIANNDGAILEGASSNFYLITESPASTKPILKTAGSGILEGTARAIVLEVAAQRLQILLDPPRESDVARASEAFISSASRGVVPVVSVEDHRIADGVPGPVTRRLISAYDERARELAVPLDPAL